MKPPLATPTEEKPGLKGLIPPVVSVIFAMIMLLPVGSNIPISLMPHLVMIAAFYWLSYRPVLMPYSACAFSGLVLDLWIGAPLGLNMLVLVLLRFLVLGQLKYYRGRSRLVYWGVFGFFSLLLYGVIWLGFVLTGTGTLPLTPLAASWLVTALAYAPVALLLGRLRRAVYG